jgi:ribonuclease BN (tRNA processing enzyme)
VRLTILGASTILPNAGGSCAGYLVASDGHQLLLDCGPGVVSRLVGHIDLATLEAVVISHAHTDHLLDLVTLRHALRYGPGPRRERPLPVHVAPGVSDVLTSLGLAFEAGGEFWSDLLAIEAFNPDSHLDVPGARIDFAPAKHYVPCWAMRVEGDASVLVYTADTGPCPAIARLAQGADVLVAEATLATREGNSGEWGHMAPEEAGALAAEAGVARLILSHYWAGSGLAYLQGRAADTFGGPVMIAMEDDCYEV